MHVSPINNYHTSFNGRFKNTPELEKMLKVASTETLNRFNGILERAAKIDDHFVYEFKLSKINELEKGKSAIFELRKNCSDFLNNFEIVEKTVNKIFKSYNKNNNDNFSNVLNEFIPVLEKFYPIKKAENRNNLIKNINKNLM